MMSHRIAVDAGGTFTDGVLVTDQGEIFTAKSHTTPKDPSIGTMKCLEKLAGASKRSLYELLGETKTIVHGTTLATNIIATRSGAKIGTITTKGFKSRMITQQVPKSDWVENPLDMYDFRCNPPEPLTKPYLMTEVEERVNYRGEVLIPLNEDSVRQAVRYLKEKRVESIAVMLMFSPLNPEHEKRIAEIIEEEYEGVYMSLSSKVLPVIGEIDRWSTTMFNAYVAPGVAGYVARIKDELKRAGFSGELLFMQSNGGVATPETIMENPATLLLSGPAAGPALGLGIGMHHNLKDILSVDMGGTSFDVGVVHDGKVDTIQMQVIDWKKFCLPSVDVTAVGAGGGSIAFIDATGRLQVGPKSAGAFPGPACYGQGGDEPTVTDANLILGYIDPDYFLGGESKLRKDLAEKAIKEKIADPLGMTVLEAASAIYDIINARMASGTDVTFAKRGYDPRDFTLCAAGGAAPVHAVKICEEMGIKRLIVPKVAPTYCAFGMMFTDLRHDFQRAYRSETDKADIKRINELYDEMEVEVRRILSREGIKNEDMLIEKAMEIRYYGQFRQHVASVPYGPVTEDSLKKTIDNFHEVHRKALGYADPNYPTEIVRLILSGSASLKKPVIMGLKKGSGDISRAKKGERDAYFSGDGFISTPVFDGDRLSPGDRLEGPSIIEERFTTFVLPPGAVTEVDNMGNYLTSMERIDDGTCNKKFYLGDRTKGDSNKEGKTIDPTTFSVVWNKIDYILEQMGQKILYSTQSFVTALARDLGQTLLNVRGEIVSAASYLPIHTMVAQEAIKGLESYFHGKYEPGDFIVANDPYIVKGGHLPDWNFIRPIFYKGEHIGFFQAKTHVADTGGFIPGGYAPGAYDIIAEGLNIPPLKVIKGGLLQRDMWGFLLRNVRNPTQVDMDTMLINGVMAQAEEQIGELCNKYGMDVVKACMEEIINAGERLMRAEIAKIPDGIYYGESATDWDGKTDKPVWVRVDAIVKGDEITFDFTKSDPQCSFVNCPLGVTITDSAISAFFLVDPGVPKNGGALRPIHVIAPPGSVVNPIYPATVGASQISVGIQIVEACTLALGKALPERAMAGWGKHLCPIHIGVDPTRIDPRTGHPRQYFTETFASDSGSGAVKGFDGWTGIGFMAAAGNFLRPNIEHFESECPYVVNEVSILQDWEGAGEFRGAPGTYLEFTAHTVPGAPSLLQTGNSDGTRFAPPGVAGGGSPPLSEIMLYGADNRAKPLRTMDNQPVFPGDRCITKCSGGGGWGDPLNRRVDKVREDVMNGYISFERAKGVYGVVIDPSNYEVDLDATERLREELKKRRQEEDKQWP